MRSDRDSQDKSLREIDDFLAQFESPIEELSSTDVSSYLEESMPVHPSKPLTPQKPVEMVSSQPKIQTERPREVVTTAPAFNSGNSLQPGTVTVQPTIRPKESVAPITPIAPAAAVLVANKPDTNHISQSDDNMPKNKRHFRSEKSSHENKKDKLPLKERIKNINWKDIKEKLFLVPNPYYDPSKGPTYMLAGKKIKNTPMKVSGKKIFRDVIALGVIMMLCFMLYAFIAITFAPRINPHDIYATIEQSSIVLDDKGDHVDSIYYTQNRKIVKYKDMPDNLKNSFIALEDKTFWNHHGFNFIRMAGAVLSSLTGNGRISGTSTITQQLARNVYLADIKSQRSIKRKVIEMYYAARIEAALPKEKILEAYLNTIYLGFGCYGVDAAAKTYFSKSVKDLNLEECAALAALPQAPDSYALIKYADESSITDKDTNIIQREPDTLIANDSSKDRRDICIQLMYNQKYISKSDYDAAYNKPLIEFIHPTIVRGAGKNSYFHEYLVDTIIEDLMKEYKMTYEDAERMVYTKGLKIHSTLDSKAQETIVNEFQDDSNYPGMTANYDKNDNILSAVGEIILYNYSNFFDESGNFKFTGDEAKFDSKGNLIVKRGHRLNIYTTTSNGQTDYSLEFKQTYVKENGHIYTIPGGYINIPADYKSLNKNDDLKISAQYFKDYPDAFAVNGNDISITPNAYSLPQKTIQPQSAMVIVGVGTGEVKAMVGGRSVRGERLLNRAIATRQPGSSIKPLAVYGAALQKSFDLQAAGKTWKYTDYNVDKQKNKGYGSYITTHSSIADEQMIINGRAWPKNATNSYSGNNTFLTAIQQSINTCAVKIQLQVGNDYSIEMLKKFGLSTVVDDEKKDANDVNTAALALGGMTKGVKPIEMALAFASFPAGGKVNTPICYTKVEDSDGKVILKSKSKQSKVMDEGVAWIMTDALKSVVANSGGRWARLNGVAAGGKTGTTSDCYDLWFDGFTPKYAAALWMGSDNNISLNSMSEYAAMLWGRIMNQLPEAKEGSYAKQPSNVIYTSGCYFTKGTEVGLSKYTVPDEEKMKAEAKERAYQEWLKERENHCHEEIVVTYKKKVPDGNNDVISEEEWEKLIDAEKDKYDKIEEKKKVYDVGWRDGDFVWDGTIPEDIRKKHESGEADDDKKTN